MIKQYRNLIMTIISMAFIGLIIIGNVEAQEYKAKVTNVVDGDTIDAEVSLGFNVFVKERFRLDGYDAPETYRPKDAEERLKGALATKALTYLILNKNVTISTSKQGKYGRWIAVIHTKNAPNYSVNQYMIDNGHSK